MVCNSVYKKNSVYFIFLQHYAFQLTELIYIIKNPLKLLNGFYILKKIFNYSASKSASVSADTFSPSSLDFSLSAFL
jgi:hypothetical protein